MYAPVVDGGSALPSSFGRKRARTSSFYGARYSRSDRLRRRINPKKGAGASVVEVIADQTMAMMMVVMMNMKIV
jgi:hypothetical protein